MNIVSFGGGTNSAAMIIGMHQKGIPIDLILFADPGGEQPHTYAFVDEFNEWLSDRGLPCIVTVHCTSKNGSRLTLEDESLKSGTLPSIAYGYKRCSLKHKIGPQDKFCNNYSQSRATWADGKKVHKYIGYDAGEPRRVLHAKKMPDDPKYEYHYPLFDWGWAREKCREVINAEGLTIPGKSSCFFCPNMKTHEIEALHNNYPELSARAIAIEKNASPTLRTIKGLGRNWRWEDYIYCLDNYEQMEFGMFVDQQQGCPCGAPCGCYDG